MNELEQKEIRNIFKFIFEEFDKNEEAREVSWLGDITDYSRLVLKMLGCSVYIIPGFDYEGQEIIVIW